MPKAKCLGRIHPVSVGKAREHEKLPVLGRSFFKATVSVDGYRGGQQHCAKYVG